jgi:TPR repeat protein
MIRRLSLTAIIALLLIQAYSTAAASEDTATRPDKQEIIDQMIKIGRMSRQQQDSKIDLILKDQSASKTIRSDFMFCIGLAYLGNYKSQTCVGSAFENGRGVVEDLSDAYTWYSIALENQAQKATEEKAQAHKDRVKDKLLSSYPSPTDDDLDDLVKAQKSRIAQYQADAKKAKS